MNQPSRHHAGFSAVELLIALFVAAVFLAAGHQLYTAIVRDSGSMRQRARASAIAQDYLQRYSSSAPVVCAPGNALTDEPVTPEPEDLSEAHVTIAYTCPTPSISNLTRTQVTVRYGDEGNTVSHAMFATR